MTQHLLAIDDVAEDFEAILKWAIEFKRQWKQGDDVAQNFLPLDTLAIGSIYENANNPNNPNDYMGFGVWEPFGEGKVTVGYSNDILNIFHNNPQIGTPIAGGLFGDESVLLDETNIPPLSTVPQGEITMALPTR